VGRDKVMTREGLDSMNIGGRFMTRRRRRKTIGTGGQLGNQEQKKEEISEKVLHRGGGWEGNK